MTRRSGESGVAMIAAVAMLILGAFIAVAIYVSARSTTDLSRAKLDAAAAEQLARDSGAMLANAYSTLESGEHDGFIPSQAALQAHASRIGGSVVPNSGLPAQLGVVDSRVPAAGRYAVSQSLRDGRTGWWQLYSVKVPEWGITPGGRVIAYVRTWTTSGAGVSLPSIYRLEFRPTWFADYQLLFDGPAGVFPGAVISGRMHSNGYATSYYDQYRGRPQIEFQGGARCTGSARVTTAQGAIAAPGSCRARANTGIRYNFLRAREAAARIRELCEGGGGARPSIQMACPATQDLVRVRLSGSSVSVSGAGTISAAVAPGGRPGSNQGAVVITRGDVEVSGALGANARALIIAAAPAGASRYGSGGAPSAWIKSNGPVGAGASPTSSFGLVVEGDIVFDEWSMNSATARGAFLTMSGMLSSHPTWRSPVTVPGGRMGGRVDVIGSITGHYPPILQNPGNGAGFANRSYAWSDALYDNPPPMFPTAADWEITRMEPANLDCFSPGVGGSLLARPDCQ